MPVDTREINALDPLARTVQAQAGTAPDDDQIGEKMVLNMGPSHPATHGVLRLRAGAGWRDRDESDAACRLPASRRREDRGEHAIQSVCPLHGPAGLSRPVGEQRCLCPRGRETHGLGTSAARQSHSGDLLRNGAPLRAPDGPGRDGARSRGDDGFPLHLHRAREALQFV